MKISKAALSIASLSLALLTPAFGQSSQDNQPTGVHEAQRMVRARASFPRALDSNSVHTGDKFRATLAQNVRLGNGVQLHKGDALLGEVVADDTNTPGNARLAIRFTEVDPKKGQSIPIKAMIVALYTPDELAGADSSAEPDQVPNSWNNGMLQIDQTGVMKGIDLHSRVASQNSGVFVSTGKNSIKIPSGSEVALAIAPQGNVESASSTN
jgi:hypothetical protein